MKAARCAPALCGGKPDDLAVGTASYRLNFLAARLNGTENPPKQSAIRRMSGQVSSRQDRIVTQMYFDDDPYNKSDPFLNSVGSAERQELLVKKLITPSPDFEPDSKIVLFDLVLLNG
jgi:hypothetical protein